MASTITGDSQDEEELNLFTSDSETSDFEGFDTDAMPLSFHARGLQDRESDNEEFLLDESSDEDESVYDSSEEEEEEEVWGENIVPQTEIPFEQRTGPVRNLPADNSVIDFFELFFTECLYRLIVHESNRYVRQEEQRLGKNVNWTELTINEFRTWLGLYFAMGIVQKAMLHSYWEKTGVTTTPAFGKVMTRDRFLSILRFVHFVDNNLELPRENPDHDRLFKARPVLNKIRRQFQQNYIPSREIAIDETMVKFKGRKFFRQFLPSKPIRFGFKLFTLAESKSGYIWDFEVYTGRKGEVEQNHTKNVVIRLMRPLEGKGYRVFTDNFYTSPELFFTLRERDVHACGTVRPNRKDLPKEIMDHKLPAVKNLDRGGALFRQKGELLAVTWKDKKPVHLITTVPVGNDMDTATRKIKEGGVWQEKEFGCPTAIKLYNSFMGGVDLGDQRIGTYKKHFKTSTWYMPLFFHCLEQACLNAFIVEQACLNAFIVEQATPSHYKPKRTQLQFRSQLSEQLIGGRSYVKKKGRPSTPLPAETRFSQDEFHYLVKKDSKRACVVHSQDVRTVYQCKVCEQHMCIEPCFQRYHTALVFKYDDPTKTREKSGRKRAKIDTA